MPYDSGGLSRFQRLSKVDFAHDMTTASRNCGDDMLDRDREIGSLVWIITIAALFAVAAAKAEAPRAPLGMFTRQQDIGDPAIAGSCAYDSEQQTYAASAAGKNIWAQRDEFRFVYRQIQGDFSVHATVRFVGEGVDPHRKLGVMARETLAADARYADAAVHGDGLASLQFRAADGGPTDQVKLESTQPTEIEFRRS